MINTQTLRDVPLTDFMDDQNQMQISLNIFADSREDLKAQLLALADAVPTTTFGQPCRGFSLSVSPEYPDPRNPSNRATMGELEAMATNYAPPGVSGAAQQAMTVPDPDANETAAQQAQGDVNVPTTGRARASRAKNNTPRAEAPPAPTGPDADETEADADPFAGNDPEPEEAPKTLTPEQAKMAALEVLREVYALPGGPKAVKAVQTEFNVTKFVEVPDGQGPRLHARALEVKAGLAKEAA